MEGLRVLFVDDEDDFRETIVKRLNARKIQAMGAESGVRASRRVSPVVVSRTLATSMRTPCPHSSASSSRRTETAL